jgi:ubiquinone/menaquinone biosynthesis C-methylase UbiE
LQDATNTTYPSGIAGVVAITFALHDLPKEQRAEVMKEAYRLLKPKGTFLIYDYNLPQKWIYRIPLFIQFLLVENLDAWRMLKENLSEQLLKVGFKNTQRKVYYKSLAQVVTGEK